MSLSRPTPRISLPDQFHTTASWRRVDEEDVTINPLNRIEWMVKVGNGGIHRVTFALDDGHMIGECECLGAHHRGWCAHLAALVRYYVSHDLEPADVSVPLEDEHAQLWRQYRRPEA